MGFLVLSYAIIRGRLIDAETLAELIQEPKLSAIGLMASSINHEVRNPLFIIKGLAETYLETVAGKDPETATDPGKVTESLTTSSSGSLSHSTRPKKAGSGSAST